MAIVHPKTTLYTLEMQFDAGKTVWNLLRGEFELTGLLISA
jgi:hypothetical protein